MALLISLALVIVFVINVAYGSINGTPVLGNVAEMLLLLAASVVFVIGILKREADEANSDTSKTSE